VGAGNVEVSQRVADLCLGALALAVPGTLGAASQGTMNNLLIGGTDTDTTGGGGRAWVYYETVAGGQGGRVQGPGMSGVHTAMTNTRITPAEALERAFPLRVLRQRLRRGSGGDGVAPGGEGIDRVLQVLTDATLTLITERRRSQPWGMHGGEPAAVGENWLWPDGDETRAVRLSDKCMVELTAGDAVRMLTPGGGGFGRAETSDRPDRGHGAAGGAGPGASG
jgi:N-methylhydantoinase B/oxoprolinase/acetone carboxylase alpha subunit